MELIEPPCIPGADKWSAKAHLQDNITDSLVKQYFIQKNVS